MLKFINVRKAFGKKTILNDVSFHIFPGEKVGLVGPNGAGKSTIFRLMIGEHGPEKGEVAIRKNARIGNLKQQLSEEDKNTPLLAYTQNAIPQLNVINDEIEKIESSFGELDGEELDKALNRLGDLQTDFEQLGGYEMEYRAETALCGLGFTEAQFDKPLREFSGGWQMRADLARTLISNPDLLLLDEPTNYLDVPAIEWLQEYLHSFQGTLILISHDRYLLNQLTEVTQEVFGGKVTRYPGNYDYYVKQRDERNVQLEAAYKNQQAKKEKLESFITKFKAKASKASQAQSRMKQLEKMEEIDAPMQAVQGAKIRLGEPPRCGPMIVEMDKISKSYDGENWIYRDASLTVHNGDKLGIVGTNGMGKTTFMRMMAGTLEFNSGERRPGHNVKMGYHSQDYTETLNAHQTVFECAKSAGGTGGDNALRAILGSFGFQGDDVNKEVGVLSGGEKVRISLARLLLNPPNFLMLDEPTTHLDIQSREALQEALREFPGTICLVSHDIEFVRAVAEEIIEVTPDGLRRFHGDYDYYREKILAEQKAEKESHNDSSKGAKNNNNAKKEAELQAQLEKEAAEKAEAEKKKNEPQLSGAERKELKRKQSDARKEMGKKKRPLEKKLETAETLIMELEEEEQDIFAAFEGDLASNVIQEYNTRLAEIKKEKETAEEQWSEITMELEEIEAEYSEILGIEL